MAITCDRHGNVKLYGDRKWFTLDGRGGRIQTPKRATAITAIAQTQGKQVLNNNCMYCVIELDY